MTEPYVPLRHAIPTRFCVRCELCGNDLDTRADGVYQAIASGWVMNRTGGGAHGVSLLVRADRWAHRYCVEERARGHAGQGSFL